MLQYQTYAELAQNNQLKTIPLRAPRGVLYDRNGQVLVENRHSFTISIVREHTKDLDRTIQMLSAVAGLDPGSVRAIVARHRSEPSYRPMVIVDDASPDGTGIVFAARDLFLIKRFDYAAPVLVLQKQIADLRAGRGMGLALAAELNGYPGPVHVLELATPLELTAGQRAKTQELLEAMKAETVPLGERLIAREAELDRLFATKGIDETALAAAVAAIGETQAGLRTAHLRYHLRIVDVLTPVQMQRYSQLRGYGGSQGTQPHVPMHR